MLAARQHNATASVKAEDTARTLAVPLKRPTGTKTDCQGTADDMVKLIGDPTEGHRKAIL